MIDRSIGPLGRAFRLALLAVLAIANAGCGFSLPPKPQRPIWMPADAVLEYKFKFGWDWSLCIDTPDGSVEIDWGDAESSAGNLTVQLVSCAVGKSAESRKHLAVEGGGTRIDFLFPEAPGLSVGKGPCPSTVSPETLARFVATLSNISESDVLPPETVGSVQSVQSQIKSFALERLWESGGTGNADSWRIRCSDISHVIPETNPDFPDQLKAAH